MLEGNIRMTSFFVVQSSKITVWSQKVSLSTLMTSIKDVEISNNYNGSIQSTASREIRLVWNCKDQYIHLHWKTCFHQLQACCRVRATGTEFLVYPICGSFIGPHRNTHCPCPSPTTPHFVWQLKKSYEYHSLVSAFVDAQLISPNSSSAMTEAKRATNDGSEQQNPEEMHSDLQNEKRRYKYIFK